jgi:mono/diheme cytochrome c family protein
MDWSQDDVQPGLIAEYRSIADPKASVTRIESKPAFTLGRSSPHPRIPPGLFEVTWKGWISIRDRDAITFSASVSGELTVTVDDVSVLDGRGDRETSRVIGKAGRAWEPGYYALTINYRSLADVPARLQLWWESPGFAPEPVPAWRLVHVASEMPEIAKRDEAAALGHKLAGRFGCARCHASALPAVDDPPPGPSLADAGKRLTRAWLINWLADPAKVRTDAHMPGLFSADRDGFIERWLIAEQLTGSREKREAEPPAGDHRLGRQKFLGLGCHACHFVPDVDRSEQKDLNRTALAGLADRWSASDLVAFLGNPHGRYPDGRMPRLPVQGDAARDIVAFLMLWSKPSELPPVEPPSAKEIQDAIRRLGARDAKTAATNLLRDKGCTSCHTGLGETLPRDVPIKNAGGGCLGKESGPRFALTADQRKTMVSYLSVAPQEKHPSPFTVRQAKLARAGCTQCHQRDTDQLAPIEEAGSKLGGAFLQELPFLRTPRLTNPLQRLTRSYVATTVREGHPGMRGPRFSYRMPAFGADANELIQAMAEADGELVTDADPPARSADDPTIGTLHGSRLAGFQGYGCVSCHVWDGRQLAPSDPIATGPDLTRTDGRLRRDWFDRYLENPLRYSPGTPMPSVFPHGKSASLSTILDGDAAKQKDALWAYFALGKGAPSPKPPPAVPVAAPSSDESPLVAQIPIRMPDGKVIESISVLHYHNYLLIYDLAVTSPVRVFAGARILRNVQGRIRQFFADGTESTLFKSPDIRMLRGEVDDGPSERVLLGYDVSGRQVRIRWLLRFPLGELKFTDTVALYDKKLERHIDFEEVPKGAKIDLRGGAQHISNVIERVGKANVSTGENSQSMALLPDERGNVSISIAYKLLGWADALKWESTPAKVDDDPEGSLERPGYKAIAYPRPKTISGEDRIMPGAVAVRPKDGQVFVASMKTGELFALRDSSGDGKNARFENYGHGLYQDALSMLAEDDGLYVLHRRNLTKIVEKGSTAFEFDRVAALPQGVADAYDMGYGLARDKQGRFVFGFAPYGDQKMIGAGGAIRLAPSKPPEEIAYGMRNPLGWCAGPEGEIFFTDNQGDWVATNKLCHIVEGRYYGWPNMGQKQHITKPAGKTTVWVPYGWARSINGVAYDNTGGKFGPFNGQFFMAELMFGGAIIRANVEKVNGVYQGACFPFWGKGLLGPLTLAFDPRGKLYVGGITEPGWMAQPDRGALFRIDYTGQVPFEMQEIHVRPQGFRIVFTSPADRKTAEKTESYKLEHYRYEYTGAYGSPELDRTAVKVERVEVAADGKSVVLTTAPLVKDRVYMISANGVRSAEGAKIVHPTGAYTLNEVPAK